MRRSEWSRVYEPLISTASAFLCCIFVSPPRVPTNRFIFMPLPLGKRIYTEASLDWCRSGNSLRHSSFSPLLHIWSIHLDDTPLNIQTWSTRSIEKRPCLLHLFILLVSTLVRDLIHSSCSRRFYTFFFPSILFRHFGHCASQCFGRKRSSRHDFFPHPKHICQEHTKHLFILGRNNWFIWKMYLLIKFLKTEVCVNFFFD